MGEGRGGGENDIKSFFKTRSILNSAEKIKHCQNSTVKYSNLFNVLYISFFLCSSLTVCRISRNLTSKIERE